MKKMYEEVICINGGTIKGKEFKEGEIYPICGYNNGLNLVYSNKEDDATTILLFGYVITDNSNELFYSPAEDEEQNIKFVDFACFLDKLIENEEAVAKRALYSFVISLYKNDKYSPEEAPF